MMRDKYRAEAKRMDGDSEKSTECYVYILKCSDDTLYCGWTNDLNARIATHNSGKGAKYTRSRLPVKLVYFERFNSKHDAMSREWHIKRMSREEKMKLIES